MKTLKIISGVVITLLFIVSNSFSAQVKLNPKWMLDFKAQVAKSGFEETLKEYISKGESISTITAAGLEMGQAPSLIADIVYKNVGNDNKNNALCGLSFGGVANNILSQVSTLPASDIKKITEKCYGAIPNAANKIKKDEGLGFGDNPALGAGAAGGVGSPIGGQIGGGGLGGGGQKPVSPSQP